MSTPHAEAFCAPAGSARASLNRLLFRKLMPILITAYVISFLDRTNIAFAKHSMGIDLGLSSAAYGLGAGLFFVTYALFEIPSNLIMHRVGARFWIARIMITWGALSDFLLGVCVANIVGGPLAGALLALDGALGLHGWQWLFIVEGVPAIALAFVVWARLPERPSDARWLAPELGRALERALASEQAQSAAAHGAQAFGVALRDPQIWLAIFVYFCHQLTIYTMIFFLPGIIGESGRFSPIVVGLLAAMPWLAAALGAATLPRFARDSSRSRRILCAGLGVMAAGLVCAAYAPPAAALASVCVAASMFFVVQSIVFTFPASRLAGSALAGGLGLVNTCGLLGGFVGPTVVGTIEQTTGHAKNGLALLAIALGVAALASLRLRHGHERAHPARPSRAR